ncbi:hypothetical protein C8R45DRAFT_960712 [Mycena sanguinolenta]|nr:hypothetical protein C8R45DRAFT_960712 [Mycena sanguinolenta]
MHFLRQSFVPVPAPPSVQTLGDCSVLIGGATMYLKPEEPWPSCATCAHPLVPLVQLNASSEATPAAFRAFIPTLKPLPENHATMVQLFVCPEEGCYCPSVGYSSDTCSWLVRIATVPVSLPMTSDASHLAEARAKIERGPGFLPARVIETWAVGKVETLDQELLWDQDDSEEFYAAHEPEPGLKLLGNTVRGKFFCSDEGCPRSGRHEFHSRRELIQLGDRLCEWEEDEALGIMATLGNTWIEQCVDHPDVLTLTMSGNW